MARTSDRILLQEFVGRNGFDAPSQLQKEECAEAINVDFYGSSLGRKRGGATALSTSGGTGFTGPVSSLFRHVPTNDDTAAELWGIDAAALVKRLAGGTAFANVTLDDAIGSRPQDVNACTFNAKLFLAYGINSNSSTDTTNAATSGANYTVGGGVTQLTVKAWGAAGGADGGDGGTAGGGGGFAGATIPVTPGETLIKRVGGGGQRSGQTFQGGGGGGYTALLRGSTVLLVAPGGGGGACDGAGGAGGGATGIAGTGAGGVGGGQAAGGAPGGPSGTPNVDYLVVAGGGGGGDVNGGGGGGGGVLTGTDALPLGVAYSIVVGAGGAGEASGNNSSYNGHVSVGGGAGGVNAAGSAGGSGGGGSGNFGPNAGGAPTAGQGNSGGTGNAIGGVPSGAGGGGAGGVGQDGQYDGSGNGTGGNGGPGIQSSISGTPTYYGGGGGGCGTTASGMGGIGGGGAGNGNGGTAGTANTGGGGGAFNAAGGSGIVIIRYVTGTVIATGGTISTGGGFTIHTFTSNGTFTVAAAAVAGSSLAGGNGGGWLSGGSAGAAGGTNGGGTGGAHGTAGTFRSGGGGGAGYFGGGGGSSDRNQAGTGGGGGGSSFVSGINTSTIAGSGLNPGNTSDPDYGSSAGLGKTNAAGNDGLLVIHATSAVDRLHVYDPNLASVRVRRVGFLTPSAPTVADHGSGSYAATLRYYRVRWLQLDSLTSTKVIRRSEPSASQSFTPSGSGASARVTQPSVAGEGETHWEIEVSLDNITFYRLSQTVIGTTTYDDSAATTTYSSNPISDLTGTYVPPTGVKCLLATASRILMAGSYAQGGKNNRVWWTPVLGSSDQGDDERIPTTLASYTDLSENAGDTIVGFGGPIFNGTVYVFMQREVWSLTPTGDVTAPFTSLQISDTVGAIHQKAIFTGEDESGQPCIYFASYLGYYRIGRYGLQYIGRDLEDRWYGLYGNSPVNLTATNMVAHGVWHQAKHQVWFWQTTDSNTDPDTKFCFDPKLGRNVSQGEVRGGWTIHTGPSCTARCSCLFSNTVGSVMSRDLKPHVGVSTSAVVLKTDTADQTDNGTPFQAFVTSPPLIPPAAMGGKFSVKDPVLQAQTQTGVTIQLTLIRDYGAESRNSTVSLSAVSDGKAETRVLPKFDAGNLAQAEVIQATLGDASAVSSTWSFDALTVPVSFAGVP